MFMPAALAASADTTDKCKTATCDNPAEKMKNYGFCAACVTPGAGTNRFTCRSGKCECATCKKSKRAAATAARAGGQASIAEIICIYRTHFERGQ
jgi:hypothetical protein